ncbi:lysophospholipid acyltransferase family protein [Acinetobacter puyangensis]|uniref:lysophospholipid acyltransferase family protein n=1 Tax=Acinetobacter puyangensis TaxID=1096779 RepID=UPI003A4DAB86
MKQNPSRIINYLARGVAFLMRRSVRLLTGARSLWLGCKPELKQRIYYANHNSHIDFVLLWSSLPTSIRRQTRPVAASDYWQSNALRQFLIQDVFHGITIARHRESGQDPLQPVIDALNDGDSVIFFPEGTRNLDEDRILLPFKSGLFHLSQRFPEVELVPVWITNLNRVMPKGAFIPLPLLSTVAFGTPLDTQHLLDKTAFLHRAEQQLLALQEVENQ